MHTQSCLNVAVPSPPATTSLGISLQVIFFQTVTPYRAVESPSPPEFTALGRGTALPCCCGYPSIPPALSIGRRPTVPPSQDGSIRSPVSRIQSSDESVTKIETAVATQTHTHTHTQSEQYYFTQLKEVARELALYSEAMELGKQISLRNGCSLY